MEETKEVDYIWESCCFRLDQRCIVFIVQTLMGVALIVFCAYMLSTEKNCDRATPYWGLIGTIAGFFFNKLSVSYYGANGTIRFDPNDHRQIVRTPNSPL